MKKQIYISFLCIILRMTPFAEGASGLLTLEAKAVHCELIAFVRITEIGFKNSNNGRLQECTAKCTVVQAFKNPDDLNVFDLYFPNDNHSSATISDLKKGYVGRTFLVYCFKRDGKFGPFGGAWALREKSDHYWAYVEDPSAVNGIREKYFSDDELVKRLHDLTGE